MRRHEYEGRQHSTGQYLRQPVHGVMLGPYPNDTANSLDQELQSAVVLGPYPIILRNEPDQVMQSSVSAVPGGYTSEVYGIDRSSLQ